MRDGVGLREVQRGGVMRDEEALEPWASYGDQLQCGDRPVCSLGQTVVVSPLE